MTNAEGRSLSLPSLEILPDKIDGKVEDGGSDDPAYTSFEKTFGLAYMDAKKKRQSCMRTQGASKPE